MLHKKLFLQIPGGNGDMRMKCTSSFLTGYLCNYQKRDKLFFNFINSSFCTTATNITRGIKWRNIQLNPETFFDPLKIRQWIYIIFSIQFIQKGGTSVICAGDLNATSHWYLSFIQYFHFNTSR